MAMPIGRLTDYCSGHRCYPPVPTIQGSSNTWCDDLPIHRLGDKYVPHCCHGCHVPITSSGSPSVYINDKPASHIGARTGCSSTNIMITGSNTCWVEEG